MSVQRAPQADLGRSSFMIAVIGWIGSFALNFILPLVGDFIGIVLVLAIIVLSIVGLQRGVRAIQQKKDNQILAILGLVFNFLAGIGWIVFLWYVFFS